MFQSRAEDFWGEWVCWGRPPAPPGSLGPGSEHGSALCLRVSVWQRMEQHPGLTYRIQGAPRKLWKLGFFKDSPNMSKSTREKMWNVALASEKFNY